MILYTLPPVTQNSNIIEYGVPNGTKLTDSQPQESDLRPSEIT